MLDIPFEFMNQHKEEIEACYNFLLDKNIKTVLEIGTKSGQSIYIWAMLVKPNDGVVYGIDLFEYKGEIAYRNTALESLVIEIKGDSHSLVTLGRILNYLHTEEVDFLFIDAATSYEDRWRDYKMYKSLVKQGGWIGTHDIHFTQVPYIGNPGVHRFWNELKQGKEFYEFIRDRNNGGRGIGLIHKT